MASISGLSGLGLPSFSSEMPAEDARELRNYLYQLQEQLGYILTNLDTENLSTSLRTKLNERNESE